jgi:hypothetical protein
MENNFGAKLKLEEKVFQFKGKRFCHKEMFNSHCSKWRTSGNLGIGLEYKIILLINLGSFRV